MKVALATWEGLPLLGPDDRLLQAALGDAGADGRPAVWSSETVDWGSFDAVVVRSTWDYHRRLPEFLRWVDRIERSSRLYNAPRTVRWNSHKGYLLELEARGVPVVPTILVRRGENARELPRDRGWEEIVVKPAVSASGEGACRIPAGRRQELEVERLARAGDVLVQPFLRSVETTGEHSLVYLDGVFSHAVRRPSLLTATSRWSDGEAHVPLPDELKVAAQLLGEIRPRPLYARVDLVERDGAGPGLMELELIEPLLYLATKNGAARALSNALLDDLGRRPGSSAPSTGATSPGF